MSPQCNRLYLFLDGELAPADHENFRHHLARCDACVADLHDAVHLEVLGQQALRTDDTEPAPRVPPALSSRRRSWTPRPRLALGAAGALAVGIAALLLVWLPLTREPSPEVWLAGGTARTLEARLAYARADQHRPYVPMRSASDLPGEHAPLPFHDLADLQDRQDLRGIAAAYLVRGDVRQASEFLLRAPASLDRDCDLAVVALIQGHPDEALKLLDGVLRREPRHPQALWNRALALRELGLTMLAAESFEAVEKLGEAGWSEEARVRARALRTETSVRRKAWQGAFAATRELMTNERAPLPLDEARRLPGIVRLAFYDAVRAASSREAALRLLPLAQVLDGLQGGQVLRDYVRRVAARDFRGRAPLARDYVRLVRGDLPSRDAWLQTVRRSGEDDLYLGALVVAGAVSRDLDGFVRIARAQKDPWLSLLAERELSLQDEHQGAWWTAEERLRAALLTCEGRGMSYRCATLRKRLADLYIALHRPADALEQASSGWRLARDQGELELEQQFLQELALIERYREDASLARAYLEESLARMPESCEQRTFIHRNLAAVAVDDLRPKQARAELDQALECGRPLELTGVWVLSHLSRFGIEPGDVDTLRRALAELRRSQPTPGEEAFMTFLEGQFEMERNPDAGRALLQEALVQAEVLPTDVDARKARMLASTALVIDAARAGRQEEVLSRVSTALRLGPVPDTCVLAVAVDHERTVLAARGPQGTLLGRYDTERARPLRGDASGLVPASIVTALRGCQQVDVLALLPVHGLPGLLPPDLAWSYRVGGRPPMTRAAVEGPPGPHLVITGVESPASLGLPRLPPLNPPSVPDPRRVELTGPQATPSRVLEAMAHASEVELHAHGLFSPLVSDASLVVLSPETDGRYALTAAQVRQRRLEGAPLVLLATCSAARAAPFLHESVSLPVAFIEAGASTVLASTGDMPDTAGRFFEAVRERIRAGGRPAVALRDVRGLWLRSDPAATWLSQILIFE